MAKEKKSKHKCPKLPEELDKVTPQGWNGESVEVARAMWYAWLRLVAKQRPLPRNTTGER